MATLEEILAEAANPDYRRVSTARVLLRQDLIAQHEQLEAELEEAVEADGRNSRFASIDTQKAAPAVAQQLAELEKAFDEHKHEFKMGSIGNKAWQALMAEHPPSKKLLEQNRNAEFDPETFPVAAIAASWIDPENTGWKFVPTEKPNPEMQRRVAFFTQLDELLNNTQFRVLWAACLEANTGFGTPKSRSAGLILRASGSSASTAAAEASPDPSSSDG